jgi:hypothetical protein
MVRWIFALFLATTFWSCFGIALGVYAVIFAVSGGAVGLVIGSALALTQLRSLSINGETGAMIKTLLYITIAFLFFGIAASSVAMSIALGAQAFFFFAFELPSFMTSFLAALSAAHVILFHNWEKRHNRVIIADSSWSTRIYVFPSIEKMHPIE